MAGRERALPDLKGRIQIDTSAIAKAEAETKASTAKIGTHVGNVGVISKETEQKITQLSSKLGALGPIGSTAGTGIGKLAGALSGSLGPALLAGGAVAALGGAVVSGMDKYLGLTKEVEHYMRVTGESAPVA